MSKDFGLKYRNIDLCSKDLFKTKFLKPASKSLVNRSLWL